MLARPRVDVHLAPEMQILPGGMPRLAQVRVGNAGAKWALAQPPGPSSEPLSPQTGPVPDMCLQKPVRGRKQVRGAESRR